MIKIRYIHFNGENGDCQMMKNKCEENYCVISKGGREGEGKKLRTESTAMTCLVEAPRVFLVLPKLINGGMCQARCRSWDTVLQLLDNPPINNIQHKKGYLNLGPNTSLSPRGARLVLSHLEQQGKTSPSPATMLLSKVNHLP